MGIEISTRAVRVAGAAMALALSACGGGGGTGPATEVASRVSALLAPAPRAAAAAAPNLLSNPDFEAGMTDWVNWSNSQVVDGAGASGSLRALRVGTAAGGASHDVGGIVAGARYRLIGQLKVSDPSEVVYLGINILDQD